MVLSHLQIPSVVRKVNNFLLSSSECATEAFLKCKKLSGLPFSSPNT